MTYEIDRLKADLAAKDAAIDTLNEWFEKAKQEARNYQTQFLTGTEVYRQHMANAEARIAELDAENERNAAQYNEHRDQLNAQLRQYRARIVELEERLEVTCYYDSDGNPRRCSTEPSPKSPRRA